MSKFWKRMRHWETWPFFIIYIPLGFVWMYYAIRARAFWFFSNVNPTIEFSGFEGETKKEIYDQMPEHYYPKTVYINPGENIKVITERIIDKGIVFPFVAKPDIGMQGLLFRKIDSHKELEQYHKHIPVDYLVQDYVQLPMEFSVFHIRYPGETKGIITGFILKEYMSVTGDGHSTLLQLIQAHPKAQLRVEEMRHKHAENLQKVLPLGKKYHLSISGNHNRGARFINLASEIDERLCKVFDDISLQLKSFYFGRYDFKCSSIEDLKAGKNIVILEYNGAGAEPNHIYDNGIGYWDAIGEIVKHWKHLYKIGRINKKRGYDYWSFRRGYRYLRQSGKFFANLKKHDFFY